MSTFLNRLREHITDVLHIFRNELVKVVKDEGVLMFLVVGRTQRCRGSSSTTATPRPTSASSIMPKTSTRPAHW